MKVKMYIDVMRGQSEGFRAFSRPDIPIPPDCIRFSFTLDLPGPSHFNLGEVPAEPLPVEPSEFGP